MGELFLAERVTRATLTAMQYTRGELEERLRQWRTAQAGIESLAELLSERAGRFRREGDAAQARLLEERAIPWLRQQMREECDRSLQALGSALERVPAPAAAARAARGRLGRNQRSGAGAQLEAPPRLPAPLAVRQENEGSKCWLIAALLMLERVCEGDPLKLMPHLQTDDDPGGMLQALWMHVRAPTTQLFSVSTVLQIRQALARCVRRLADNTQADQPFRPYADGGWGRISMHPDLANEVYQGLQLGNDAGMWTPFVDWRPRLCAEGEPLFPQHDLTLHDAVAFLNDVFQATLCRFWTQSVFVDPAQAATFVLDPEAGPGKQQLGRRH